MTQLPTTAQSAELTRFAEHPGSFVAFRYANVLIVRWQGRTTAAATLTLYELVARARALTQDQAVSLIHIIDARLELPDADTRTELERFVKGHSGHIAYVAVLTEGSGFRVSAIRAVMTGLNTLIRSSMTMRAFTNVEELTRVFSAEHHTRTNVLLVPADLGRAIEQARISP